MIPEIEYEVNESVMPIIMFFRNMPKINVYVVLSLIVMKKKIWMNKKKIWINKNKVQLLMLSNIGYYKNRKLYFKLDIFKNSRCIMSFFMHDSGRHFA